MRKLLMFLLISLFLVACNVPFSAVVVMDTPTYTPSLTPTVEPSVCAWVWATKPLPDLSSKVQAALESASLPVTNVFAEAFGENCVDSQTNQVTSFGAMETDFRITLQVKSLKDAEKLGSLLEQTLVVLDGFPTGSTPGSQPGIVGVTFQAGKETTNLSFTVTEGKAARDKGLRGAALLEALTKK